MDWDLAQLRALDAVVSHGTFDAAARALHVTPSAVSQRIKALEAQAGRVLVRRSKPVTATEDGQELLRLARQVSLLVAEAEAALTGTGATGGGSRGGDAAPRVVLPVAVNADSLTTWAVPALAGVGDGVYVDVRREDQDHSVELLRDGEVMAAITTQARAVQGCTVTALGAMRYLPAASPAFARRWFGSRTAPAVTPDALAAAPVVVYDRKDDLQDRYLRRRTRRRIDPPRHHVPGSTAFAQAVRLGLGWGMLPEQQADELAARGDVVVLDADGADDVRLHWQQWRLRSSALDALAASVRETAARALRPTR
ncbi:LysR family transcriptional regulator ArgP [Luteimicrobium xylanilyticum]|uniref:HTH-type transcriptional regulator ArgP n=1 Tax=Luteimicrobium xylanilyticum TaxID=1133546 RepID=A0A5P9Q8F9_9MICO|nr:LysR family transcriptional regulator ArgP [Luteimicrobium xylanilyticum]QFU97707.1 HTH-type transcriptional regulator ArgP [Luteimicrobium xylanilyticum]